MTKPDWESRSGLRIDVVEVALLLGANIQSDVACCSDIECCLDISQRNHASFGRIAGKNTQGRVSQIMAQIEIIRQ